MTGPELRELRLRHAMTLAQVAKLLRLGSITTVSRWERGEAPIPYSVEVALRELLRAGREE